MRERTEIKICGLTNIGDAEAALELGADFLGFVLYPDSPRGISPVQLLAILARLPEQAKAVGVFVNADREWVLTVARECGLAAVQLHGDETADKFRGLPMPIWRAVRRAGSEWRPSPGSWSAARYVIDAFAPAKYGGTGQLADWPAAAELAAGTCCMLAGGLTPENVADGIRVVRPKGVDVAGGVEAAPGRKDYVKMEAFVRQVRAADVAAGAAETKAD